MCLKKERERKSQKEGEKTKEPRDCCRTLEVRLLAWETRALEE